MSRLVTALIFTSLLVSLIGCGDDDEVAPHELHADVPVADVDDAGAADDIAAPSDISDAPDSGPARVIWGPGSPGCPAADNPVDKVATPPIHTPRWAFEPWISKDISDGPDTYAFVGGFIERDIPVGVVVIDSPWETNYNSFVPNPERYPDFGGMVADLAGQDVRVVLWITQMINRVSFDVEVGGDMYPDPSPNQATALECGFAVNGGEEFYWWKGFGVGLDFFDPHAVTWWHRQQDLVLDMGISGWKLDFGDTYVDTEIVTTAAGDVPHQEYSEEYYRDYWAYGVSRRGAEEFVTMVRPWDESYEWPGRFHARPEHAPVTWVGDNRRDWVGLIDALDHMLRSAAAGYVVIGSDIGGYLDVNDKKLAQLVPYDGQVLDAWTAVGALTPFMELHGRGNLTPWTVPDDPDTFVANYRYWSKLHHQLVPFFYSLAQTGYQTKTSIMRPIGEEAEWPTDYRYLLGEAFLVAPLLDGTGKRDVPLPAGHQWYDWWDPGAGPLAGGQTLADYDATDRRRIPVFVRAGAIVPLHVDDDSTALGDADSADKLTLLVVPHTQTTSFTLTDIDDAITELSAQRTAQAATVSLSRAVRPVLVRLRAEAAPTSVEAGAALTRHDSAAALAAADQGWRYDATARTAIIKLGTASSPTTITALW